jgi:hypothetical protein
MSVTFIKKLGRNACAVAVLALAARASSAAVFLQPTATGTTPSGLQWSTVSTGSSLPVRSTTLAANARQKYPEHVLLESEHQTLTSILALKAGV